MYRTTLIREKGRRGCWCFPSEFMSVLYSFLLQTLYGVVWGQTGTNRRVFCSYESEYMCANYVGRYAL